MKTPDPFAATAAILSAAKSASQREPHPLGSTCPSGSNRGGAGLTDDEQAVAAASAALATAQRNLRDAVARVNGKRQARLLQALDLPYRQAAAAFRAEYLNYQRALAGGSITATAKAIGCDRSNLNRKIRHLAATDRRLKD
jgi:DNA-binding NtrC family response regulator